MVHVTSTRLCHSLSILKAPYDCALWHLALNELESGKIILITSMKTDTYLQYEINSSVDMVCWKTTEKMISGSTFRQVERGGDVNVSGVLSQHPGPLGLSGAHLPCVLYTFWAGDTGITQVRGIFVSSRPENYKQWMNSCALCSVSVWKAWQEELVLEITHLHL